MNMILFVSVTAVLAISSSLLFFQWMRKLQKQIKEQKE